jgi:hypothetical protein
MFVDRGHQMQQQPHLNPPMSHLTRPRVPPFPFLRLRCSHGAVHTVTCALARSPLEPVTLVGLLLIFGGFGRLLFALGGC